MRLGKFIFVAIFFAAGCDRQPKSLDNSIARDSHLQIAQAGDSLPSGQSIEIKGIAVLDISGKNGANIISGMKVRLIDCNEFQSSLATSAERDAFLGHFAAAKINELERSLSSVQMILQDTRTRLSSISQRKEAAEQSLKNFRSVQGHYNFRYADFSGRILELTYAPSSGRDDSYLIETDLVSYERNIDSLKAGIQASNEQSNALNRQIDDTYGSLASMERKDVSTVRAQISEFRSAMRSAPNPVSGKEWAEMERDVLLEVNKRDEDFTDEKGEFSFSVSKKEDFLIFANHEERDEKYTWLVKVISKDAGYRRTILSSENSLSRSAWRGSLNYINGTLGGAESMVNDLSRGKESLAGYLDK